MRLFLVILAIVVLNGIAATTAPGEAATTTTNLHAGGGRPAGTPYPIEEQISDLVERIQKTYKVTFEAGLSNDEKLRGLRALDASLQNPRTKAKVIKELQIARLGGLVRSPRLQYDGEIITFDYRTQAKDMTETLSEARANSDPENIVIYGKRKILAELNAGIVLMVPRTKILLSDELSVDQQIKGMTSLWRAVQRDPERANNLLASNTGLYIGPKAAKYSGTEIQIDDDTEAEKILDAIQKKINSNR